MKQKFRFWMLVISLILLSLLIACSKKEVIKENAQEIYEEIKELPTEYCKLPYYQIKYVNQLHPLDCYATVTKVRQIDTYFINQSLKHANKYAEQVIQEESPERNCFTVKWRSNNPVYCLLDNSTCLLVEDNKICQIHNLTDFNRRFK